MEFTTISEYQKDSQTEIRVQSRNDLDGAEIQDLKFPSSKRYEHDLFRFVLSEAVQEIGFGTCKEVGWDA